MADKKDYVLCESCSGTGRISRMKARIADERKPRKPEASSSSRNSTSKAKKK